MLSSFGLQRRNIEEDFDKSNASKQESVRKEIEKLDGEMEMTAIKSNSIVQKCLNCQDKGYKHMNRHFCSPECASKYYWMQPDKNPYKPSGGRTKRRKTKKTKIRKGKSYRKQQKKQSKKL
jgi:hypothetical protein